MTTIAIIGAGAMGSGFAWRLHDNGCRILTLLDGRSEATHARAADAGMVAASLAEIGEAELMLSIVPPAQAGAVVETLAPIFASGKAPVFCDANAVSPETKKRLAARVAELGGRMVDGSIIGAPPQPDYAGPRFYLAGEGAEEVARLGEYGIDARVLSGPLGSAAALKMCFGGINKGIIGLATAMLLAARREGAADDLRTEMGLSMEWLLERLRYNVPAMYPKAYRWDAEMHEISAFLASSGDPAAATIWEGLGEFFTDRAKAHEAGEELDALKELLA